MGSVSGMERKTVLQMWAEANERIDVVSPEALAEELATDDPLLLDVRLPIEIERRGTIDGSVPVARQVVEGWAEPDSPYFRPGGVFGDFDRRTVTFCEGVHGGHAPGSRLPRCGDPRGRLLRLGERRTADRGGPGLSVTGASGRWTYRAPGSGLRVAEQRVG